MTTDFEAEGLLDGVDDPAARAGRVALLERLHNEGFDLSTLRDAVERDRLALLPVDRVFSSELRYSARHIAREAGIELRFFQAWRQATGFARPDPDEIALTEDDLQLANLVAGFLQSGIPEDGILDVTRVLSRGMVQLAATLQSLIGKAFSTTGDTELELAQRYATAAVDLSPKMGEVLDYALRAHLRERIRQGAALAELAGNREQTPDVREVAICFADLVGFTKLGERVQTDELGDVVARLDELGAAVANPPVTLVKTIGDAVMLASPDPVMLVEAALTLVGAVEDEGQDFPQLRAGIALGEALDRGGDWYGRPVNLASRITGVARPGTILATQEVHDAAPDAFRWSFAGGRRLKGVTDQVALHRVRALEALV